MYKTKDFYRRVAARLSELPPRYPQGDARNYERMRIMVIIQKEESANLRAEKSKLKKRRK
ncbi:MAG: hypothetical protein MUP81_01640 [Dehalococcoidia bacterium]|nr:hypothetical protein [Dehalococcoidia bacterium]